MWEDVDGEGSALIVGGTMGGGFNGWCWVASNFTSLAFRYSLCLASLSSAPCKVI